MKEWRARLQSWPKEAARVPEPKSIPGWVRSPERLRKARNELLCSSLTVMAGFVLPIGLALFLTNVYAPSGKGGLAALLVISGMILSIASLFFVGRWLVERFARESARRATEMGPLDAEAVGVAYADGVWRDSLFGDSWDWGALRLGFDRLDFVGRSSRFELRPEDVIDIEARQSNHPLGGPAPRLYLRYAGAQGIETVGIELPYRRSARRRVEGVEELRDRIERWRKDPLPTLDARPSLLPLDGEPARVELSRYSRIGRRAKWLAFAALVPLVFLVQIILEVAAPFVGLRNPGGLAGGLWVGYAVLWIALAEKIERRLPAGLQYKDPLPSLGEASPGETAETTLTQR